MKYTCSNEDAVVWAVSLKYDVSFKKKIIKIKNKNKKKLLSEYQKLLSEYLGKKQSTVPPYCIVLS